MRVSVRLFAGLRERAGRDMVEIELPEGAVVGDALARLRPLVDDVPVVMAVNRSYAETHVRLQPGDELALIPPVSGGAAQPGDEPALIPPVSGGAAQRGDQPALIPPVSAGAAPSAPPNSSAPAAAPHARVTAEPLALQPLIERVRDPRAGAIVTFLGVTREVAALEYEAYVEMATHEMAEILRRAIDRHGLCAAAAEHRVGTVPLSEPSVAVAASAPHREAAFAGAREIIDELKARAPIWKQEEGRWVVGTTPTPERRDGSGCVGGDDPGP